jgi:uncharacterized membrane protein
VNPQRPRISGHAATQRWDAIDIARGVAVLAMVVYHFSWDLSFLKLTGTNILEVPAWRWFARSIAGSFLALTGIGLMLAHARGFRPKSFLWRLAKISGAALAVTVASYLAFPQSYIFFGILHCIALSSLLALPFLRLHPTIILAAAASVFAAPLLFTHPTLDAPLLDWLGLGSMDPVTNDDVPVFPWFACVLIGVAVGRGMLAREEALGLSRWRGKDALSRGLGWAGRKSLPIYLIHQLVLLAVLYGVLQITGPSPAAEAQSFTAECEASCRQQNGQLGLCQRTCSCIVDHVRETDLWPKILGNRLGAEDQTRISRAAQQCLRSAP